VLPLFPLTRFFRIKELGIFQLTKIKNLNGKTIVEHNYKNQFPYLTEFLNNLDYENFEEPPNA